MPQRGGNPAGHASPISRAPSPASTWSSCSSWTTGPATEPRTWPERAASITSCGCAATKGSRRHSPPGIDASLKHGADFIVNTDADNQYAGKDIAKLLEPLLKGQADIVIGDRNIADLQHMSWRKRQLQRLGSWVVRQVSNTSVPDTTSGFRAYTREAALRMTIVSEFSYTLETIIQAGKKRMAIAHVPSATNPRTRKSRLFDSLFSYIKRSSATIVRIYAMYEPLKVFTYIGCRDLRVRSDLRMRFVYE